MKDSDSTLLATVLMGIAMASGHYHSVRGKVCCICGKSIGPPCGTRRVRDMVAHAVCAVELERKSVHED